MRTKHKKDMHERDASLKQRKEHSWRQVATSTARLTDARGTPIDPGIMELVIALNISSIKTRHCCEGHLDHGDPAPWITFGTPGAEELLHQAAQAFEQAERQNREQYLSFAEEYDLYQGANQLKVEAEAQHARDQHKLIKLLAAFYQHRSVPYDRIVIVYPHAPAISVLECQGSCTLVGTSLEIRQQKLQEYQQEMNAFALFLKERFFAEE